MIQTINETTIPSIIRVSHIAPEAEVLIARSHRRECPIREHPSGNRRGRRNVKLKADGTQFQNRKLQQDLG